MIVLNKYNQNNLSLIMKKYSVTSPNKLMKIDKKEIGSINLKK